MKLREIVRKYIFSGLMIIVTSLTFIPNMQAMNLIDQDLDADSKGVSLEMLSEEDQQSLVKSLKEMGYEDAITEETNIADEKNEIESFKAPVRVVRDASPFSKLKTLDEVDEESKKLIDTPIGQATQQQITDKNVIVSSNVSGQIDPKTVPASTLTYATVTDEEVKADFRYKLTKDQQKDMNGNIATHKANNCLKMRKQLEKMFNTEVTPSGGTGKLYYGYFQGHTSLSTMDFKLNYARAFVNSRHCKDVENNKEVLAKLAAETFVDVNGTEPYAYLVPTAVYYGLITPTTVTAQQAAQSKGAYKEGDLLAGVKSNVTYIKLSKMVTGYDGYKREVDYGLLKGTEYSYMGNIEMEPLIDTQLNKNTIVKNASKGEVLMAIMGDSYLTHFRAETYKNTFKDLNKIKANPTYDTCNAAQLRAFYQNCIANPSSGAPYDMYYAITGANKAGIKVTDANGNTNWYKTITVGDALILFDGAARVD